MDKYKVIGRVAARETIAADFITTKKTNRIAARIADSFSNLLEEFFPPEDLKGAKSFRQMMRATD